MVIDKPIINWEKKTNFAGRLFPGFKNVTTWSSTSSPAIAWKNGPDNRVLYGITIKEPTLNIGFALNDETLVGIVNMNVKRLWNSSNDCYYDLQGKQQSQPKEGYIYIHLGQKVNILSSQFFSIKRIILYYMLKKTMMMACFLCWNASSSCPITGFSR